MRARVVTINLEGVGKGWFEDRGEAAMGQLAALEPDIICMQEVTVCHQDDGDGVYNQARAVAEACGLEHVIFDTYGNPQEVDDAEQGGLGIASRWPFSYVRDRRLPHSGRGEPDGRIVLLATLLTDTGPLEVLTTHLAWHPDDEETRLRQADMIFEIFTREGFTQPEHRALVTGDFNATPDEEVVRRVGRELRDAWEVCHPGEPGHTWVKGNPMTGDWDMPDRRLDYVFCPQGVTVHRAEIVLDKEDPVFASDHFGLLVELEWED